MELTLFHALIASLGLTAIVLVFALLERLLRHAPVDGYRVGIVALASVLGLPVLYVAAEASGLSDAFRAELSAAKLFTRSAARSAAREPIAGESRDAGVLQDFEGGDTDVVSLAIGLLGAAQHVAAPGAPAEVVAADLAPQPRPTRGGKSAEASSGLDGDGEYAALRDPRPWLAGAWGIGVAIALVRIVRRLVRTRALVRAARAADDPPVMAAWERALSRARVPGARLVLSHEVETPACAGLVERVVVLPEDDLGLRRPEVLECVLLHELVHLERRDAWVQLAEELLCAAFWFHPAAFLLAQRIATLRELACDALVVERTGGRRRYAAVLLEYAARLADRLRAVGCGGPGEPNASSAALVPWSRSQRRGSPERSTSQLTRRIEMLFTKTSRSARPLRAITYSLAAVFFGAVLCGQLALASALGGDGGGAAQAGGASALVPETPAPVAEEASSQGTLQLVAPVAPSAPRTPPTGVAVASSPRGHMVLAAPSGAAAGSVLRTAPVPEGAPQKLGVMLEAPGPVLAAQLALPEGAGLVVMEVVEGSPAERAGLARFDVIVEIDGAPAGNEPLAHAKTEWNAGAPLELAIVRAGRRSEITVPGVDPAARERSGAGQDGGGADEARSDQPRRRSAARERVPAPPGAGHAWPESVELFFSDKLHEEDVAQSVEQAQDTIAQLLEQHGIASQGDLARDALEVARRYYASIEPQEFAREMQRVLPGYLEELRKQDLDASELLDHVRAALERVLADPERYLTETRRMLLDEHAVPAHPGHLRRAAPDAAPGRAAPEHAAPKSGHGDTRADSLGELDRLRDELGNAMSRIQEQMRDLETLHQRVQELVERQGGGR